MSGRGGASGIPDYLQMPLGRFLEALSSGEPAPGGGAAAAVSVAMAAGLAAMAARLSSAGELAERADALREEVAPLARADAEAFGRVLAAYRLPRGSEGRRERIGEALGEAAGVPLEMARIGAEVCRLAGRLALEGNPNLKGDAVAGALLAEAGVRAAAELVEANEPEGERALEARRFVEAARRAREKMAQGGG
ncbi:Formimidoyltetrahydrofolate cyclodeaminase [Rubrobacter xylanophilus DSM 9941]|uniref:Formimidoyltetrahydrofolate cyclodeaminase n=1 Tax=Rubrobacter xylanophilus (strain DSM 9941 / JCM 11954 / NBRC 16129 / PRD-1) TaxID=266117 RepID=Q1AT40_RUBXD|nr:cyclodeaminase/cyclohydrolase family protein [Rubrobacter xylanophilus]ABG04529.1 Formiminotransferase-cyclodeaminase [Rubrobacter xylanophilus DSM 9941]ABG05438.1 Formimidoyltetrahydrofolate cyclodeaminase [Rubrobacter xylanophilus DSM 9941]